MNTNTGDTFEVARTGLPLTEATATKVGFRELTSDETKLVREFRALGSRIEGVLKEAELSNVDKRWLAIARTHFQEGLMAGVRSVTKPDFF